jgi:hypothetical protein
MRNLFRLTVASRIGQPSGMRGVPRAVPMSVNRPSLVATARTTAATRVVARASSSFARVLLEGTIQ